MIIKAALLTYRDGPIQDQFRDLRIMDLVVPNDPVCGPEGTSLPKRIEVFPSTAYYLLADRNRLAHPESFAAFGAVYLKDLNVGKDRYH